ncbi:hypothetical protein OROGR_007940 [Orobanche gracilis]
MQQRLGNCQSGSRNSNNSSSGSGRGVGRHSGCVGGPWRPALQTIAELGG